MAYAPQRRDTVYEPAAGDAAAIPGEEQHRRARGHPAQPHGSAGMELV